ncbi:hypothetical protein F5B18DRAFT_623303 [Nemania serpens]|nr:hypothetical protein F5B18DRAFT_623303 [Nemania serpens]
MVFIPSNIKIPRLNAYLVVELDSDELQSLKRAFEFGTCAPFNPRLELVIKKAPQDYIDKPFGYIRFKENEAGRTKPFVLIDTRLQEQGAVWYVANFASDEDVKDKMAESTSVVWKIPLKTECLPITFVNYDIANKDIREDLGNLGVNFPVKEDYEVEVDCDCGGLDIGRERKSQQVWATAYPDEYEESTDEDLRRNYMPRPKKVARLKEGIADKAGVINRWTIPTEARARKMKDGSMKEFPKGSVVLQLTYNTDFNWPEYKWPEGSL